MHSVHYAAGQHDQMQRDSHGRCNSFDDFRPLMDDDFDGSPLTAQDFETYDGDDLDFLVNEFPTSPPCDFDNVDVDVDAGHDVCIDMGQPGAGAGAADEGLCPVEEHENSNCHEHEPEAPAKKRINVAQSPRVPEPSTQTLGHCKTETKLATDSGPAPVQAAANVPTLAPNAMTTLLVQQHILRQLQAQQAQMQGNHNAPVQQPSPAVLLAMQQKVLATIAAKNLAAKSAVASCNKPSGSPPAGFAGQAAVDAPAVAPKPTQKTNSKGKGKGLSVAERRRKRSQQLLKNRAAADRSRAKKKQELQQLQHKVGKQAEVISILRFQVTKLDKENRQLRKLLNERSQPVIGQSNTGNSGSNGGIFSGFFSSNHANRRSISSPVTLCAIVFTLCMFTQPLQYAASVGAAADLALFHGGDGVSESGHSHVLSGGDGEVFRDSGSMFGVMFDGAYSLATAAKASEADAAAAELLDEVAVGKSEAWKMSGTNIALELIFAAAMAAMVFLSYHIIRLWVLDCKSSSNPDTAPATGVTASVGLSSANDVSLRRRTAQQPVETSIPVGIFGV
mmetsp:Transcript_33201/g.48726  ORF Transcript_33201/g.48726 Transcript_33201/m.48726 type:complete len:562 (-) Transcript_33201:154-1839(-)|eukprot:CAMPEP_0195529536 /NCGR_PEP_ID=MMETSP0794_2-20130614/32130_1 /TAXON_ID=515487 /ORGANISM="Stephanopyxis turris, Strain CCMP 815" /LENGTH=561 /DNA_ID=CAMNT_0040660857 /DNA_START=125 /DNA_END=1810 /DNA_ORIENTATION=+